MRKRKNLIVGGSFLLFVLLTIIYFWLTLPTGTTILEIVSNPEAWVDKRVMVSGILFGPLISIPEVITPYDYLLQDKEKRTTTIGVKYFGKTLDQYVTVIGIVKAGHTEGPWGEGWCIT